MSLNRYKKLIRRTTFHDHNTVIADFPEDRFVRMGWLLTEFEKIARNYYRHTEFAVIDETLRNLYASYNCDFKVYMKNKPGNYGLLFLVLADVQDRHASSVIPYVAPPINNPEEKGNIHDLVMEIPKDILNTGINVTGDRLYSAIDTFEELYHKKNNLCRKNNTK